MVCCTTKIQIEWKIETFTVLRTQIQQLETNSNQVKYVGFQDPVILQSLIYLLPIPLIDYYPEYVPPLVANPFVLVNEYLVLSPVLLQYLISLSLISRDCLKLPLATSNRLSTLHLNNTSVNRLLLRLQQNNVLVCF